MTEQIRARTRHRIRGGAKSFLQKPWLRTKRSKKIDGLILMSKQGLMLENRFFLKDHMCSWIVLQIP